MNKSRLVIVGTKLKQWFAQTTAEMQKAPVKMDDKAPMVRNSAPQEEQRKARNVAASALNGTTVERLLSQRHSLFREIERDAQRDLAAIGREHAELERLRGVASRGGIDRQRQLAKPLQAVQRRMQAALTLHKATLAKVQRLEELDRRIAELRSANYHQPAADAAQETT